LETFFLETNSGKIFRTAGHFKWAVLATGKAGQWFKKSSQLYAPKVLLAMREESASRV
jgi:hypothetical protein